MTKLPAPESNCRTQTETVHACALRIGPAAALIRGPSGSGKSSLCLELIALGAELIADDQVRLTSKQGAIWAQRPASLPAAIEARGVGLLPLPLAAPAPVRLVVDMGVVETERLPPSRNTSLCGHIVTLLHRSEQTHFASALLLYMRGHWSE
ncbi:MAG: serine kinase [Mangrovicoccus sp.]|nr:serine kinase [Mangrovicoccus sp.]